MIKNLKLPVEARNENVVNDEGNVILSVKYNTYDTPGQHNLHNRSHGLEKEDAHVLASLLAYLMNTELGNLVKESVNTNGEELNEEFQILDKVYYNKERGYINGQLDGKFIVQVQGSTYMVDPKDLKEFHKKPDVVTEPHMKFDDQTQALLFEQYIRCGVYMGNVPIRLNECFIRYDHYAKAGDSDQVKVIIEGSTIFLPKSQVRILENINDFANPDNFVPGVIVDETGQAIDSVLVNAIDYTQAIGDADEVKIIMKTQEGTQEMQSMPKYKVRTLAV